MAGIGKVWNRSMVLALGLALAGLPVGLWAESAELREAPEVAESNAPGLADARAAADQHGNVHRWTAEAGAVTIVDFAASWCGPCRQTLPKLQAFADEHPEVRVLVISVDEKEAGRDALVHELGLTVPVLWDRDHRAAESYRPEGMPATFVFDAAGKAVLSYSGSSSEDWQTLTQTVGRLLSSRAP